MVNKGGNAQNVLPTSCLRSNLFDLQNMGVGLHHLSSGHVMDSGQSDKTELKGKKSV